MGVYSSSIFLLVWACFFSLSTSAKYVPPLELGFMFSWTPTDQPVPIPVSVQCETLHISWSHQGPTGPSPTAPYSLQIYTSTFIVPFIIDAGFNLDFDWDVPFAPGTQYQICMFDKNGVSGGCQEIYTVIPNTTVANPTCQNITFPVLLDVVGTVKDGTALSQFGFIDQCSDIIVTPKNGTPPFTLTVAPSLHPPYNITSNSMDPIAWTISLTWASPLFISLTSSDGKQWSQGPLHAGGPGTSDCLAPGTIPKHKSAAIATGVGVGTFVAGVLTVVLVVLLLKRTRPDPALVPTAFVDSSSDSQRQTLPDRGSSTPLNKPETRLIITGGSSRMNSLPTNAGMETSFSPSVFLVHRDGGQAQQLVELPPSYRASSSIESVQEATESPPAVPEKPRRYLVSTSRTLSTSSL